jgi:hypothetical protein
MAKSQKPPARGQSHLEDYFIVRWLHLFGDTLPAPEEQFTEVQPWLEHLEYRKQTESARCRKWIADYAWPEVKVLVDVQGGVWHKSGHSSPKGLLRDYARAITAAAGGWLFIPVAGEQLTKNDYYLDLIAQAIRSRM